VVRVLLDTCVLSELRKPGANANVRARVEEIDAHRLFLSVITLGELTKGVILLTDSKRKRDLTSWLLSLEQQFVAQILPIDQDVARLWGELTARARTNGVQIGASDGLIAATALRHGLHVMTRNTRHFAASGALIIDPWSD
jgi:toxin FitB